MRIYLDTKDLIEIIENSKPCSSIEFKEKLRNKNHEIVISNTIILEISEPLIHMSKKTNVMNVINILEMMPHVFINTKNIIHIELLEAIDAFKNERDYQNINPFRKRYSEILEIEETFPIKKSLSEIVWTLYMEGALGGFDKYSDKWINVIYNDRNLLKKPTKKGNFIYTIQKHLSLFKLKPPAQGIKSFAEWIYKRSFRCPSTRLINEVYYKIVKNIGDNLKNSDLEDFSHLQCLPYVDLMTVDRRLFGYISQANYSLKLNYDSKIRRSAKEILELI